MVATLYKENNTQHQRCKRWLFAKVRKKDGHHDRGRRMHMYMWVYRALLLRMHIVESKTPEYCKQAQIAYKLAELTRNHLFSSFSSTCLGISIIVLVQCIQPPPEHHRFLADHPHHHHLLHTKSNNITTIINMLFTHHHHYTTTTVIPAIMAIVKLIAHHSIPLYPTQVYAKYPAQSFQTTTVMAMNIPILATMPDQQQDVATLVSQVGIQVHHCRQQPFVL